MQPQFIGLTYFIVLVIHLVGIYTGNESMADISKPLLMLILTLYFVRATIAFPSELKKWVISALILSWVGDILLMFQADNALFFISGLAAFLLAHICYIVFFNVIRSEAMIPPRWPLLLIVVLYYALLMYVLYGKTGDMTIPVRIYGVVISFMCMLALHLLSLPNKRAGIIMAAGAVLFVISDSLLAINKFDEPFPSAGYLIMLTYGLAQFSIIEGGIRYISSVKR